MPHYPVSERLERRLMLAVAPIGPEFRVNTFTPNIQAFPATAMDANGNFVVAWASKAQDFASSDGVYAQRYNAAGVPRGGEFLVNQTVVSNQYNPQVAMNAAGEFVVAWQGPDASESGIYARRYDAAGVAQGGEFAVNTTTFDQQTNPAVAMDADGDFVVAWVSYAQDFPSTDGIFAQRFSRTGARTGGEFPVNNIVVSQQRYPSVAMDPAGDFVIAWESGRLDPDTSTGIAARRYDAAGNALGGEFHVNQYGVSDQNEPAVAMDAAGDFVITWHGYEFNGNTAVYARRYNAAGAAGAEFKVSTTVPRFQRYASIAMDANGDFVIAWQNEHGDANLGSTSIDARRYSAAGVALTGEFRVNTTTLGNHRFPATAMDADGDFLVAWAGYGQDPGDNQAASGIYAQRYGEPHPARVTQVYVRGHAWSAPFLAYLESRGLGSSQYGFAVGGGAGQLADLPWNNITQVSVGFDQDVSADVPNLVVRGVNVSTYSLVAVFADPVTHVVTWTLAQPLAADKISLDLGGTLDGEWTTGGSFPSGNGTLGGDFRFRFDVLPGNVNRVGSVLADDFSEVKSRFFRSTASPGSGATAYTIFHDVDGNGSIVANDFSFVKSKFFSSLPGPEPAAVLTAVAPVSTPVRKTLLD